MTFQDSLTFQIFYASRCKNTPQSSLRTALGGIACRHCQHHAEYPEFVFTLETCDRGIALLDAYQRDADLTFWSA